MSSCLNIDIGLFSFKIRNHHIRIHLNPTKEMKRFDENYWHPTYFKNRFIIDDIFTILEVMGVCTRKEFESNAKKEKYFSSYIYRMKNIDVSAGSVNFKGSVSYNNFISLWIRREFSGLLFYKLLQTFKEEGWYSKICGEPSEEKVKEKALAIEEFKQLRIKYFQSVPKLTPEWTKIVEEMEKMFKEHLIYSARIEKYDISDYQFLETIMDYVESIRETAHTVPEYAIFYDPHDDGGSLALLGGNRSISDPQRFINYIRDPKKHPDGVTGYYRFKNPGKKYVHPKKGDHGEYDLAKNEKKYKFEAGNIEELAKVCEKRLKAWKPEEFDIPQDILKSWYHYNPHYEGFYHYNSLLEDMFEEIKLFDLVQDHKLKNKDQFHYRCPGYDDKVEDLIDYIMNTFEDIWESPLEDVHCNFYHIKEIILRNFILSEEEKKAWEEI